MTTKLCFIFIIFLLIFIIGCDANKSGEKKKGGGEKVGNKYYYTNQSSGSSGDETFNLYHHLSTKTPYWVPHASRGSPTPPAQCELARIDMLARHGSRMPELQAIMRLNDLVQEFNKYAANISEPFRWILNWTVPYPTTEAGYLILQGELEHYNIAKRLIARFPDNFPAYIPYLYNSSCTKVGRTGISANSFTYGLFEGLGGLGTSNYQPVFTWMQSNHDDKLLRFFDICQPYMDLPPNREKHLYEERVYPNISINIATLLGLQDIWDISPSFISIIFSACAYELSVNNITTQWCSLLSESDILAWEYSQDIDSYWDKSYGNQLNYIISSLLFQDMIRYFDDYIEDPTNMNNTNVFRFAHAETLIPLVTLLGLYKDPYQLTSELTDEQIANRQFRTSVISPYASNLALLFFDCGNNSFKIRVDHNEIAILVPGCDDIYCNYTLFKELFKEALVDFNWDKTCDIHTPYASDKEWKILMGIFTPFSFIIGIILGLFVPGIFRKIKNRTSYHTLNDTGLVFS